MLILGLFLMGLTGGIGFSAILNALTNHTTVENTAEPAGHRWTMALRVPSGRKVADDVCTITFPHASANATNPVSLLTYLDDAGEKSSIAYLGDSSTNQNTSHTRPGRTFAIVTSDALANPWDCGTYENWCQVMGHSGLGWFPRSRSAGRGSRIERTFRGMPKEGLRTMHFSRIVLMFGL